MATSNHPTTANQTSILRASLTATPHREFRLPIAPLPTAPRAPPPGFPNAASNPGPWPPKTTPTPQSPPANTPRRPTPTPVSTFSFFRLSFRFPPPYHARVPFVNPAHASPSTPCPQHPFSRCPHIFSCDFCNLTQASPTSGGAASCCVPANEKPKKGPRLGGTDTLVHPHISLAPSSYHSFCLNESAILLVARGSF